MRPKDRVLTAIDHKEPDRVPIQTYLTPEIHQRLVEYFGTDNVLEPLGVDFRGVGPRRITPVKQPEPESNIAFYDEWGVGYAFVEYETGKYAEAADLALARIETMEQVEAYPWPRVEDYDFSQMEAACDEIEDFAVCFGSAGIPDIVNGVSRGRGMERVLTDIMTEDPVGVAIIDRRVDFYYDYCRKGLEAANGKIDLLLLGEDCGTQNGPLFPPDVFRSFFFPRLKKFIDLAHEFGAKAMFHSCGSTRKLMPTFVEMGLDVLDAMQPEPVGMVPCEIKAEFGHALTFCGLISTQQTLPFGTVEDCRREAEERIRVMGKGGGYIFAPAHCIQPDTPLENVLAIYEVALGRKL